MSKFKQGGFQRGGGGNFGGRSKFGGNKFGGGRDRHGSDRGRGPVELYPAVCAQCGKNCEVPFRPTGDKPVYCRDCFGKQPHVAGRNSNGQDRDFRREERGGRDFQPQPARPQSDAGIDDLKRQLNVLESKVSRILELVSQNTPNEFHKLAEEVMIKKPASKAIKKIKKAKKGK